MPDSKATKEAEYHEASAIPGPRSFSSLLAEGTAISLLYGALAMALLSPLFDDPWQFVLDPDRVWLSADSEGTPESMAWAKRRDIRLLVWVYAWDWHALTTAPMSLFAANAFYPAPAALALSEHAIGKIPITGPLFAISKNPVFAHQVDLLLTFALSGAALYALLRSVGAARGAAFLGGLLYAFSPARIDSLYHSALLSSQYLPLVILFAERSLFGGRARDAIALGTFLLLLLLSSYYLAYQVLVATTAYGLAVLWKTGGRLPAAGMLRVLGAGAIAAILFVAVSLPYLSLTLGGVVLDYASLKPALAASANGIWQQYLLPPWLLHTDTVSGPGQGCYAYVGWISLGAFTLGSLGDIAETAARGRLRAGALGLTLACWVFALGPTWQGPGGPIGLPYEVAMDWIPGFASMRVPGRFALSMMVGWTVLAGLGIDRCLRLLEERGTSRIARHGLTFALGILLCLDYGYDSEEFPTEQIYSAEGPLPIYRALAKRPPGPVLELPIGGANGLLAAHYMSQSTAHWMPLLNGSSGYHPVSLTVTSRLAQRLPDPRALELLGRLTGLRYVLIHKQLMPKYMRGRWKEPAGLIPVEKMGPDVLYEVESPPPTDLLPALRECARDRTQCQPLLEMTAS